MGAVHMVLAHHRLKNVIRAGQTGGVRCCGLGTDFRPTELEHDDRLTAHTRSLERGQQPVWVAHAF